MTIKCLTITLVALMCVSCVGQSKLSEPDSTNESEILANPKILANYNVPIEMMSLRGVKLGDEPDAIKPNRVYTRDNNGWIICRDSDRYRVLNGKVVTLGVWDQKVLSRLGVNEETDIEKVFGKSETVEKVDTFSTKMTIYRFAAGQRRVSWDNLQNRLGVVNIGSSVVLPSEAKPE